MRLPKALAACVAILMVGALATAMALPGNRRSGPPSVAAFSIGLSQSKGSTLGSAGGTAGLVPGAGTPIGQGTSPASPAGAATPPSAAQASAAPASLPVPTAGSLPALPTPGPLHSADAIVLLRSTLSPADQSRLGHIKGVSALTAVDTGTVTFAGAPAVTFGVDPGTFRSFTPQSSASVDRLWQYLAGGSLVSSYEMATDRKLQLGVLDAVVRPGDNASTQAWMGAFASLGLPGVDLLVDRSYSKNLGLTPATGVVISAPGVDGPTLQSQITQAVPGATVELLRANQIPDIVGNGLDSKRRATLISAALSKVGRPYVWGGAGPDVFDCSGLVQWAYAQAGVLMPRTAAEQFLTGEHIPMSAALPGDLLFWTYDPNDPTFVDHVAIYLGNGMMVVAPHTGLDVQVVPVPTDSMAGVVRVVLRGS